MQFSHVLVTERVWDVFEVPVAGLVDARSKYGRYPQRVLL